MKPEVAPPRRMTAIASLPLREAASIARDAAEMLAEEALGSAAGNRFRMAADRITVALDDPDLTRHRLLGCSPAVIERSGRPRTLVEMIETEPEDAPARLRLAKLLLRALTWDPESFPEG